MAGAGGGIEPLPELRGAAAIADAKRTRRRRALGPLWVPFGAIWQKKSARRRRAYWTLSGLFRSTRVTGREPEGRTHRAGTALQGGMYGVCVGYIEG